MGNVTDLPTHHRYQLQAHYSTQTQSQTLKQPPKHQNNVEPTPIPRRPTGIPPSTSFCLVELQRAVHHFLCLDQLQLFRSGGTRTRRAQRGSSCLIRGSYAIHPYLFCPRRVVRALCAFHRCYHTSIRQYLPSQLSGPGRYRNNARAGQEGAQERCDGKALLKQHTPHGCTKIVAPFRCIGFCWLYMLDEPLSYLAYPARLLSSASLLTGRLARRNTLVSTPR